LKIIYYPDDGGSTYLWNFGLLWEYTALYPRRLYSSYLLLWQPEISQNNELNLQKYGFWIMRLCSFSGSYLHFRSKYHQHLCNISAKGLTRYM
jgi:hypothetical protein